MSEAQRNALILKFIRRSGMLYEQAEAMADDILETLGTVEPEPTQRDGSVPAYGGETFQVRAGDDKVAGKFLQRVVGPDGLTDQQRLGAATVGLCPNCQQPVNAHLPACLRDTAKGGFEPSDASYRRAITDKPLPPAV